MRPAALAALGVIAGLLSGMLGIGGGMVVGPALALAGLRLTRATGTALALVAPVAISGVLTEGLAHRENLDLGLAAILGIGGVLGVVGARRAALTLPETLLRRLFALLLLATALRQFGLLGAGGSVEHPGWFGADGAGRMLLALGLGGFAGVCAILFGVGGGIVMVPGMVFAVGALTIHEATAISLLAMVPTAAYGGFAAWRDGRVDRSQLLPILAGAVPAAACGVLLRNEALAPRALANAFGAFLLLTVANLLRPVPARR